MADGPFAQARYAICIGRAASLIDVTFAGPYWAFGEHAFAPVSGRMLNGKPSAMPA